MKSNSNPSIGDTYNIIFKVWSEVQYYSNNE